jgi:hypothetical protein
MTAAVQNLIIRPIHVRITSTLDMMSLRYNVQLKVLMEYSEKQIVNDE